MQAILFWLFTGLMLLFGAGVVLFRNPVSSAMSLVGAFISLAGLFFLLEAFFIGIIQILVYAGAVMVLFLFIIMLLDLKAEAQRRLHVPAFLGGGAILAGFVWLLFDVVRSQPNFQFAPAPLSPDAGSDVERVGFLLFSQYNLAFQVIGLLLLVATLGVVILSKKELK